MIFLQTTKIFFTDAGWTPGTGWIFFAKIMFGLYAASLIFTSTYCLLQFQLLYYYRKFRSNLPDTDPLPPAPLTDAQLPFVTIQLPMYNEMYVAEKLIDHIVTMDYPKEKYEIHVIDDSTDDTVRIAKAKVEEYKKKGFNIEYIRRENRQGYKAGALKAAMQYAKGEFIAIFDADFEPRTEFLRRTVPYFQDPKIGIVQTRWEHINENYSLVTKLQTLPLNVHFTVEQLGRSSGHFLLQFNGTAAFGGAKQLMMRAAGNRIP